MNRLADGEWHRLEDPVTARGIVADADVQLEIDSSGRCRLAAPLELLDADSIRCHLDESVRAQIAQLDVHTVIDSTNTELQRQRPPPPGKAHVCLAEFQNAGRGRRGRAWLAPFGHSLCLSVAWQFPKPPRHLSAASLAVGIGVVRALQSFGVDTVALKWPNDLYCDGRKLGGVLIDAQGSLTDMGIVVGVGLNLRLAPGQQARIAGSRGVDATDLDSLDGALCCARNRLAAALLGEMLVVLERFGEQGLAPWADEWRELDLLRGQAVEVVAQGNTFTGRALGIDESGALLVQQGEQVRRVVAAEVSVRQT